ncbi:MAG: serine/threonine protein kinase, partial [Acidobacteria bacterium]|nr:serine/threonine protein kinase [Acidobacteriota bacterium]
RADLYALGTIAYLMLGGKTPFTGDLMQLVMQKIMHTPAPISTVRSDIPPGVERVIMNALEIEPAKRPSTVGEWIAELEKASEDMEENVHTGKSRLVVLAPINAEVYVDDERKGSVGSSGRLILSNVPVGRHILRVSKTGEKDDERVIEITNEASEQVIQAQLKPVFGTASQPSPSRGTSQTGNSSLMPGIVACANCNSRFAEGVKFCGRCGNRSFTLVSHGESAENSFQCPRCQNELPQNSKFCGRCGLSINRTDNFRPAQSTSAGASFPLQNRQTEKSCRKCGTSFSSNIKFCGRCGSNLSH